MRGKEIGRRDTIAATALALVTIAFYWWVWGSWSPPAVLHDEAAYLLQARIFASGHWTAPAPPIPEFFEQFHVLVSPRLAAKYFPGHSLALMPGALMGFPALMPLVMAGIAAALVFTLSSRLAGIGVGLCTWALWLLAPINVRFWPSYLSETTTATLTLVGWWALVRWKERGSGVWLVVLSAAVAWAAITRPFAGLALAVSTAPAVARLLSPGLTRRAVIASGAVLFAALCLVLLYNREVTGSWSTTPYALYTRMYMPWDRLGFGLDSAAPVVSPSPEMLTLAAHYEALHADYTAAQVPATLLTRVGRLLLDCFGPGVLLLGPFLFLGFGSVILAVPSAALFVLALIMLHLAYAHQPYWTAYYLESVPVFAFAASLGLRRAVVPAARARARPARFSGAVTRVLACLALAVALAFAPRRINEIRSKKAWLRQEREQFGTALRGRPTAGALVFVRYAPWHDVDRSLVWNQPNWAEAPLWVAHDLGARNQKLVAVAGGRRAYLYDEQTHQLRADPQASSQ